jgi:hypothetical protein
MIIKATEINRKPMSVSLVTQLIYDSAMSLENNISTKEQTLEELLNIVNMIDERGIKL